MSVDAPPASALLDRVRRHAEERPAAIAYQVPGGASLTYRDLAGAIASLAEALRGALPAGATVILCAPNQLEYPIAFLAVLAAGCRLFPVSPESADAELLRAASEAGAAGVIGDDRAMARLGPKMRFALPIESVALAGSGPIRSATQGALLLQSSGTTGLPKIVVRTGASLDAAADAMSDAIGFRPDDRVLMTIPLTHSYGLEHGLFAPLWAGSGITLFQRLTLPAVLPELTDGGITILPGVPSTFEMLARVADAKVSMGNLRLAYSAGAPLPRAVFDAFAARFGVRVTQLYGASEIGSVSYNPPADPFDPASVGRPMRGVSIRILDPNPNGREGQVAVRAESMFASYLNEPAGLIDGHFPTGDLGHVDDSGRLFVTGRIKLLIDVGGFKVNPLEVEAVLQQHPAVAACVVVAVRQSQTVFRLKAILTPAHPGATVPIEELRQLARAHLAAYKIPRLFEVRDSLPRSATGKILRDQLETA